MNNRYSIVIVMFAVLSLVTSCLTDSDTKITYYNDAALTSFSLGNMSRKVYTKTKSGKDTSYVTTYSAAGYTFSIDHSNGKVFNVDSLPKGTNLKKCLVTVNAINSGLPCLKSLTSDSIFSISSTDSLDFSQIRTIVVVSNDGSYRKNYEVEVRVHKEAKDSLYWDKKCTNSAIAAMTDVKAAYFKGSLYALGTEAGDVRMYRSDVADGKTWAAVASLPFSGVPSVATDGKYLYVHSGNKVYNSADGINFTPVSDGSGIKQIIAASRSEVYALTVDGRMVKSADNGYTWNYDQLDADEAYLPQQNINGVSIPSVINPEIDKVMIIGNREDAADTTSVVWTKVVDNIVPAETMPWMYQKYNATNWHPAPRFDHIAVAKYGEGIMLLGSKKADGASAPTYSFLYSRDCGLNWWKDTRFTLPANINLGSASYSIVSDEDHSAFWIICGETGEVWRGYYSTLSWE